MSLTKDFTVGTKVAINTSPSSCGDTPSSGRSFSDILGIAAGTQGTIVRVRENEVRVELTHIPQGGFYRVGKRISTAPQAWKLSP